jgi:predicted phosphodiesterase
VIAGALDLGVLDGPVVIFGGPYGNLEATRAVLAEAGRLGIAPARIICTGDVVAYCADPETTVDLIRNAGIAVVMGNCEESLGFARGDCGCGFEPGSGCDLLSGEWFAYADARLGQSSRAWLRELPRSIRFGLGGRQILAVHGAVSAINRFLFASTPDQSIRAELALTDVDGVVAGHCGLPFTRFVDGRLWHNAGVVGMPANDGTARGWYSILTPGAGGIAISHRPLDYDHLAAAAKMRAARLVEPYAQALASGVWPSLEILPIAERAATGIAISAASHDWPMDRQRELGLLAAQDQGQRSA